jgi:hypothetical protein
VILTENGPKHFVSQPLKPPLLFLALKAAKNINLELQLKIRAVLVNFLIQLAL